ncbi:MAG: hypothetical protein ACREU7_06620 [Burkholderiales bacterium]
MQANRAVFQRSPALLPPCEWIEIQDDAPSHGLPGRVFLSPSVWLCCVYHDARDRERIDTVGEALRLRKLLAAALRAWRGHAGAAGRDARGCVFRYLPGARHLPGDTSGDAASGFLLRVSASRRATDGDVTRIDLLS